MVKDREELKSEGKDKSYVNLWFFTNTGNLTSALMPPHASIYKNIARSKFEALE